MEILLLGVNRKQVLVSHGGGIALLTPFVFVQERKGWRYEYNGTVFGPFFDTFDQAKEEFVTQYKVWHTKRKFQS